MISKNNLKTSKQILTFKNFPSRRFNLIESKETEVLADLEVALRLCDPPTAAAAPPPNNLSSSSVSCSDQSNLSSNGDAEAAPQVAASPPDLIDGDATQPPICRQPNTQEGGAEREEEGKSANLARKIQIFSIFNDFLTDFNGFSSLSAIGAPPTE